MKLRALVVHLPSFDPVQVEELASKLDEIKDEEVLTKRLTFAPLPRDVSLDKALELADEHKELLWGLMHLTLKDQRVERIPEYLEAENVYASILMKGTEQFDKVEELYRNLDPERASRFSITFSDYFVVSPYFPSGTGDVAVPSLSASLLYVEEFRSGNEVRALARGDELARIYAKKLGVKYLGLDVSLSPWGKESVGTVIEELSGKRLYDISHIYTVHEINQRIFRASVLAKVNAIGFSELMLPVAEDDTLTQRASEGLIRLKDLVALSFVCVAGLDMVAVRPDLIRPLIKDMAAVYHVKRRPVGMRVIPTQGGDVMLKKFGRVVEIPP